MKALPETISQAYRERFLAGAQLAPADVPESVLELAVQLQHAYPALAQSVCSAPGDLIALSKGLKLPRDAKTYRKLANASISDLSDNDSVRRGLRRFAAREKLRVAARELTVHAGGDVDVTARELSDLADVCSEVAIAASFLWAEARFGTPRTLLGDPCPLTVIGMGKLGGRELNAGSDIDVILFYETDEGEVVKDGAPTDVTLHEYFSRVAQRYVALLDDATEDGIAWRVDLRLRPEGSRGPLVNALAAAERYYETWGRAWERAALVRARPVAGDLAFGGRLLAALSPFIWRKSVDPKIALDMRAMLERARAEADGDVERDLKLGTGGIREVEFFAQSLQLIWGGREKSVRTTNTLEALRRLRARGFVTDREGREMADAYLSLRRLEHRIQFATGIQTHSFPEDPVLIERLAWSLGFPSSSALVDDLKGVRAMVATRFLSLSTDGGVHAREDAAHVLERLYIALDNGDEEGVHAWLSQRPQLTPSLDFARHLLTLARRPDWPLGTKTRDTYPELANVLVEALCDAADPEQATRLVAAFFGRLVTPSVYVRALAEDPNATRKLAGLFGASAFLGASLVAHPELFDRFLYGRTKITPHRARTALEEEIGALGSDEKDDAFAFVGATRRAKERVTMEVGLADLAGEIGTRDATLVLSELADATVNHVYEFVRRTQRLDESYRFVILAMGKLGGREIGYGSDLDICFVYEDDRDEAPEKYVRAAQRILRLLSTPHDDGTGYELDTRLRPSGNQGLLVVSYDGFVRYQKSKAEAWERQALIKARVCAGDEALGERLLLAAAESAYMRGAPDAESVHALRMRMEAELGRERLSKPPYRFDLKVGRGGLFDAELAAQWLQMKYGTDLRVRTTDTETALTSLENAGYLVPPAATALRDGYAFLRRLEQRLRVLHGTSAQLLEEGAPGLALLARRMGMRDGPRGGAPERLLERYVQVTNDVRAAYLNVLGIAG